jgi:hypothetical protein
VNGRAELVVQDGKLPSALQRLEEAEATAGVREGMSKSNAAGIPWPEARKELRRSMASGSRLLRAFRDLDGLRPN